MTWLMQNPLVIVVAGLIVEVVLFRVLQQTGKKPVAWAMAGVALLVVGLVALERWVETPEEAIRAKLYQIAFDAQNNDVEAIVAHSSRRAPDRQAEARRRFNLVKLKEVSVKEIAELQVAHPPERGSAIVRVKAVGSVSGFEGTGLREFRVDFVLEDDVWKIRGWDELGNPLLPQP